MNEGEKVAFYENERAMNELKLIIFSNLKIWNQTSTLF
jgi:hypothetical protein